MERATERKARQAEKERVERESTILHMSVLKKPFAEGQRGGADLA